jgi:hypothetical protein
MNTPDWMTADEPADRKATRMQVASEQARLDRAAAVEVRRAELGLERQRQAAKEQARRERTHTRRQARKALVASVSTIAPTMGRRVMLAGPILAPMSVAWVGQIQFAIGTLRWPLVAALVFAASWELTTASAGWMYHQARKGGDRGTVFRVATWLFAASAGAMNYWHALGEHHSVYAPTPKAVSYGAMSLVGIALWELYASLIHRQELRARGALPAARPRFGLIHWMRFFRLTWTAWSLSIRDGITTTEGALAAARADLATRGKRKGARRVTDPGAGQVMVREVAQATDPEPEQVTPEPLTQAIPEVTPEAVAQVTPEATPEPVTQTTPQATTRVTRKPRGKAPAKSRRTDAELIAELDGIVAEHYRENPGQEINVKPVAARLGIGRDRCRRLLDQMSVRPIRKVGT